MSLNFFPHYQRNCHAQFLKNCPKLHYKWHYEWHNNKRPFPCNFWLRIRSWEWYTFYKPSGSYNGTFHSKSVTFSTLPKQLKLVRTNRNQFEPVSGAHDKEQHCMGLASLQIQHSNNEDVLLDSGFNLFEIIANLCSKLYYEVLLKPGNYIVNIYEADSMFRTWIVRQCNTVWVCKLADIVTSLCSVTYALRSLVNKWNVIDIH